MKKPTKLLTRFDLRDLGIKFCNVHLIRLERAGRFPKRVRLSPYCVMWVEAEITQWLEERMSARGTEQ